MFWKEVKNNYIKIFFSFSLDEVTNIQLHPSFIFPNNNNNKQHSTARTKRVIGNFQRSVYTPTTYNSVEEMFSGDITPDTIPVLLRDLRHDDDDDETKVFKSFLPAYKGLFFLSTKSTTSSTQPVFVNRNRAEPGGIF